MKKEKEYSLNGHDLLVIFEDQLVRIKNPKALQDFLLEDIRLRSEVLVNYIKQDYFLIMNKELNIENDSMIIEIWGHAYATYFANALKNLVNLNLIENLSDFILQRSETIDCGESEIDTNRKFWDVLSKFKSSILSFLP